MEQLNKAVENNIKEMFEHEGINTSEINIGNVEEKKKELSKAGYKLIVGLAPFSGHDYKLYKDDKLISHFEEVWERGVISLTKITYL